MATLSVRGPSLYVGIWRYWPFQCGDRLYTSESDVVNSFSAGTVFIRQNLTSADVRFWRLQMSDSDVCRCQILTSADVRFWRLQMSDSDVCRCQILTYKDGPPPKNISNGRRPTSIGIQMKRKDLTKTFVYDDFKFKKPFGLHSLYDNIWAL